MENRIRLLVVDDEGQFLETISKLLERRGFAVTPVSSGKEAIKAARKQDFEVALVDLKMPGINGEQVLEALKNEHRFMEVIILTGHGTIDSAMRSSKVGVFSYLQKPCELDTLLYVLKEAYQKHIQNKYAYNDSRMKEIVSELSPKSPLAAIRKLKEIDKQPV